MRTGLGLLVAGACVLLLGCAAPQPEVRCPEPSAETQRPTASPPTRVFVVRHAEKADDGTKNPPLLPEGTTRATCLAQVLSDVAVTHVFATDLQRTALTVQPLAASKSLEVQTLPASDIESLAEVLRALPPGSVAVVAGHSNSIPLLTDSLGAPLPGLNAKGYIPDVEHDRLIELVLSDGAAAAPLTQLRYCAPSR